MRSRRLIWILSGLLLLAGAWFFWHQQNRQATAKKNSASRPVQAAHPISTAPKILTAQALSKNSSTNNPSATSTNKFAYRLSNTAKPIGELVRDEKAILLANALIDLRNPLNFSIPKNLQAQGDPGAYIVQANGPIDSAFRAMLAAEGATIVSYIPNDAYLVRASSSVANGISADGFSVIPYEPYYKVQSALLPFDEKQLPGNTVLNLGLFGDDAAATIQQIKNLGGQILAQDSSPFGPIVRVLPPANNWTALAQLSGVQIVEPYRQRAHANDLSRTTVGVSTDSTNAENYTNVVELTGKNVTVEENDSGIDATHPDLTGRVFGDATDLTDTDGHGTHVAGIIAGDGTESTTVTNVQGSINPGVAGQYRGMAPMADLFIQDLNESDATLQETPALTNALISNNSWVYDGNSSYDLAAASYDAATRDALPALTGSQPVLFVFAAGNDGNGDDSSDPGGGSADTIQSPATAKDVITVGALQEFRNITNEVTNADGSVTPVWEPETSTSYRVAGFSSRGNVGIGTEGTYGRYKPDVVAPGTFIVSTRSSQWDVDTYFYQDPTNYDVQEFDNIVVQPDSLWPNGFPELPNGTIQATIQVEPNADSPDPFPSMPIYVGLLSSAGYDFDTTNNEVLIPGSPEAPANYLNSIFNSQSFGVGFDYGVSNTTSEPISFDLITDVITTNNPGNYFLVLSNLDNAIGGPPYYYRYESGTSMAAPAVSGVLALMQSFFTNVWQVAPPSPALLKAMLINGARASGFYNFQAQNSINYEGWGLINLPDSLPPGIATNGAAPNVSMFIQDQSPTNALATGDSQTFKVTLNTNALAQPLRVTLAWTDPPGDPAAATKLVNDLNLVVTNLDDSANPIVYYGNDIPASSTFNSARSTNTPPVYDDINNVENVYLPQGAGTNFSVTVLGYRVNVNAVTAQTNNFLENYAPNVVQDYALVISSGDGAVTNAMTVMPQQIVSNPTTDQQITVVTNSSGVLLNQTVGANSPLLGTNTISFGGAAPEDLGTNWQVTVGMTNQWHFYVVTNNGVNGDVTNAAFITFDPATLSIPRAGVFADSQADATRPEADIDVYVSTDPGLTNLEPNVISNAVVGTQVGASVAGVFTGASLSRGGTEFVADTNSTPGRIYYVGVKSEDQMASEYGFLSVFTAQPFSVLSNGVETVNGLLLPVNVPDGSPAHPGIGLVFALAIYPIDVGSVVVSDTIEHQNFGDLIGTLKHNDISTVLNNHDSLGNPPGPYSFIYDDSGSGQYVGSQLSDGPGSLNNFIGTGGVGPWILNEVDDSLTQTGFVSGFQLTIQPHQSADESHTNTVQGLGWFYDYIDVPPGATNLTISVTNISTTLSTPPLELFVQYGALPTTNSLEEVLITNVDGADLYGSISIGAPLTSGRYYFGVYNPSTTPQEFISLATFGVGFVPTPFDFTSGGPATILDDAITTNSIFVSPGGIISSVNVGLVVDDPRISDLVFHLISPDGTRVLLMENRGGTTTDGAGGATITTNTAWADGFEEVTGLPVFGAGDYFSGGWYVDSGDIELRMRGDDLGSVPYEGNYFIDLNGYDPGEISTNISTISGQSYILNFAYARNPDSVTAGVVPSANVLIGNNLLTNIVANYTSANNWSNLDWQPVSVAFTANSSSTLLTFQSTNTPGASGVLLDAVSFSTLETNYSYLTFTEDTNLTTTPIKFAVPPFTPQAASGATVMSDGFDDAVSQGGLGGGGAYIAGQYVDGWLVETSDVDVLNNTFGFGPPATADTPPNCLDLSGNNAGTISTNFNTVVGQSYALSFAYTKNPNFGVPNFIASANVSAGSQNFQITYGGPNSGTALNWAQTSVVFTATSPITTLRFSSLNPGNAGIYLDTVVVSTLSLSGINYLPEQSLDAFTGENSLGNWLLEIQDDRAGAGLTNTLESWQLQFTYTTATTSLTNGEPATNSLQPGGIAYYLVNVPTNADFATNSLFTTSGPLNFWFNETTPPSGTNSPGDYLLFSTSVNDSNVLSTASAPTNIVPGGTYYLAVQNPNAFAVTNFAVQVDFHLLTVTNLAGGQPQTNTVDPGSYAYFAISVPTNADIATNILLSATGPVNLLFDQTTLPTGLGAGDFTLLSASTGGSTNLTLAGTPPLVPGTTYYLGVQNTNTVAVTFGIEVDFHLLVLTNPPITISSIIQTNIDGTNGFWLTWFAPSNDLFQVQWTADLAPPQAWSTFTNIVSYNTNVFTSPTNTQFNFFDDGSQFPFGPLRFYRLILLGSGLTNGVPETNSIPANSITYYSISVPTNADFSTNSLFMTNGPLSLLFNQTVPPTGTNAGDYLLFSASANDSAILSTISTPTNIVPGGIYYLGVQNTNSFAVNYSLEVDFHLLTATNPPTNAVSISSITYTNAGGTNEILLQWIAPADYQFQIQWTTNLAAPIAWNTVSNVVITSTTTNYSYLDDGSLTGGFGPLKFYRLIEYPYSTPIPMTLSIANAQFTAGGIQFQWSAPTNYQYEIQWTTNLALPLSSWSVLPNPALSVTNGVFTFTDTNQTRPSTSTKFFRLVAAP